MFCSPVTYTLADKQLCFVHIPKTAGSALTYHVRNVFGPDDAFPHIFMKDLLTLPPGQLQKYRYIGAHLRCNIRDYLNEEPTFITMLRDPVKRVISHYRFMRGLSGTPPYGIALAPGTTFEQFLHSEEHRFRIENHHTVYLGTDLLLENEPEGYNPFPEVDDAIFQQAKKNLDSFLFVGIQERFEESMNVLCRRLGWPAYRENQKINVTPGRTQEEEIPSELIDEIRRRNPYDMALYEYANDLLQKQLTDLSSEGTIYEEADRFYNKTFKKQYPATDHFHYDFRYAPIGSNWHMADKSQDETVFRNMGPKPRSFVDLPLNSDKDLLLTFEVLSSLSHEMINSLKVSIQGAEIECERMQHGYSYTYTGRISKDILAKCDGRVRITFEIDQTIRPKDLGINDDTRSLGPAFSSINVMPAPSGKSDPSILTLPFRLLNKVIGKK